MQIPRGAATSTRKTNTGATRASIRVRDHRTGATVIGGDDFIFLASVTWLSFLAARCNPDYVIALSSDYFQNRLISVFTCRFVHRMVRHRCLQLPFSRVATAKWTNQKQYTIGYPFMHLISSHVSGALRNDDYTPICLARNRRAQILPLATLRIHISSLHIAQILWGQKEKNNSISRETIGRMGIAVIIREINIRRIRILKIK